MDAYYRADYMGSMVGPSVNLVNNISLALVTIFGAIRFIFGKMTLGNISSFVLYSRKFSGPINESANIMSELQSALAAAERVFRLLDETEEPADSTDAKVLTDIYGDVELSHVSFGYTKDHTIIHDLSLHAEPGKLIAIVGPTGAGKTTIINLLMRFYDIDSGKITIDGNERLQETVCAVHLPWYCRIHGCSTEQFMKISPTASQMPHSKMCSVSARPPVFITI